MQQQQRFEKEIKIKIRLGWVGRKKDEIERERVRKEKYIHTVNKSQYNTVLMD